MNDDKDPIEGLLDSFSRDKPIDWDSVTREAGPEHESRIEALRDVSTIASFNRALQRGSRSSSGRSHPPDGAVPDNWGELLILESIASTARSELFRAWDPGQKCDVALRLLRSQPTGPTSIARGVEQLIGVRHPNLIALLGVDQRDGRLGAWMEFLNGVTLERHVEGRGPLRPGEVARLGIEIGSALSVLHEAGAIHGRIRPANVTLDRENRYRLAEIEIAAQAAPDPSSIPSAHADIFSLASVLWFAATGQAGPSPDGVDHLALPPALMRIMTRAIDPELSARFQSSRELVQSLEEWRSGAMSEGRFSAVKRLGRRLHRLGKSRREGE